MVPSNASQLSMSINQNQAYRMKIFSVSLFSWKFKISVSALIYCALHSTICSQIQDLQVFLNNEIIHNDVVIVLGEIQMEDTIIFLSEVPGNDKSKSEKRGYHFGSIKSSDVLFGTISVCQDLRIQDIIINGTEVNLPMAHPVYKSDIDNSLSYFTIPERGIAYYILEYSDVLLRYIVRTRVEIKDKEVLSKAISNRLSLEAEWSNKMINKLESSGNQQP